MTLTELRQIIKNEVGHHLREWNIGGPISDNDKKKYVNKLYDFVESEPGKRAMWRDIYKYFQEIAGYDPWDEKNKRRFSNDLNIRSRECLMQFALQYPEDKWIDVLTYKKHDDTNFRYLKPLGGLHGEYKIMVRKEKK